MRILATKEVMNTNPKFDFYAKLHTLLWLDHFNQVFAQEVLAIHQSTEVLMSADNVTIETFERWHECLHRKPEEGKGMTLGKYIEGSDIFEVLSEACFEDLSPQMRSEAVRALHQSYKVMAGITGDLFIRVRKVKDLGLGFAALTVVTDNADAFREFWKNPDEYIRMTGHVHYSETSETVA